MGIEEMKPHIKELSQMVSCYVSLYANAGLPDAFGKYKTMQGYQVLRKVGWDTHGLPVEVQVEKELGFNGKQDIEKYGIKEFNEKCSVNYFFSSS